MRLEEAIKWTGRAFRTLKSGLILIYSAKRDAEGNVPSTSHFPDTMRLKHVSRDWEISEGHGRDDWEPHITPEEGIRLKLGLSLNANDALNDFTTAKLQIMAGKLHTITAEQVRLWDEFGIRQVIEDHNFAFDFDRQTWNRQTVEFDGNDWKYIQGVAKEPIERGDLVMYDDGGKLKVWRKDQNR